MPTKIVNRKKITGTIREMYVFQHPNLELFMSLFCMRNIGAFGSGFLICTFSYFSSLP